MSNNKFSTGEIRQAIEEVKQTIRILEETKKLGECGCDLDMQLESERIKLKALTWYLVDELNEPFKWQICKRKDGTEFLKLITYNNEAAGYIEVGRFNMSKHEYIQNRFSINDIYEELEG